MASDWPTPPVCDSEVFDKGILVFKTNFIPPNQMEAWVQKVAKLSGQRVDWHFVERAAYVRALGDIGKVTDAINQLRDEHDTLRAQAIKDLQARVGN